MIWTWDQKLEVPEALTTFTWHSKPNLFSYLNPLLWCSAANPLHLHTVLHRLLPGAAGPRHSSEGEGAGARAARLGRVFVGIAM